MKSVKGDRQGKFPKVKRDKSYRQTLEALFCDGAKMAGADPVGVARILKKHNIDSVFIGGVVIGCHTGRPRATQDLDLIILPDVLTKIQVKELGELVKSKKVEKSKSFYSFIKNSVIGDREVLDIITSKAGSYGLVFGNSLELKISNEIIKIPSAEMMVVLKYTAAINPIRSKAKQLLDWSDIFSIADANTGLDMALIKYLGNEIVPGFGDDICNRIKYRNRNEMV